MAWAEPADAALYTGITPTGQQIQQAQGVIEMFADVTEDADDLAPKNLRLLKQAVAYQAAWITEHPDAFTGLDVDTVSQDSVALKMSHANARVLAPLAKRCVDRLSWKRNRALRIGPRLAVGGVPRRMNTTSAVMDDNDPRWQPLGGDC